MDPEAADNADNSLPIADATLWHSAVASQTTLYPNLKNLYTLSIIFGGSSHACNFPRSHPNYTGTTIQTTCRPCQCLGECWGLPTLNIGPQPMHLTEHHQAWLEVTLRGLGLPLSGINFWAHVTTLCSRDHTHVSTITCHISNEGGWEMYFSSQNCELHTSWLSTNPFSKHVVTR